MNKVYTRLRAGMVFSFFAGAAWLTPISAHAASVGVSVSNVAPNGTAVYAALCVGGIERSFCRIGDRKYATDTTMRFQFNDVPPGSYAILSYQDLNGNGSLDRTPLGLPLEPYALSNGAGRTRKPTYEQAAITIGEPGREVKLELRVPKAAAGQ